MNIIAGHGGSAWQPKRLIAEAYDETNTLRETLAAGAITMQLQLGPLGTLTTGSLGIVNMPAAWEFTPWPRTLRFKLTSELGTGYIATALVNNAGRNPGALDNVPLTGRQSLWLDGPGVVPLVAFGAVPILNTSTIIRTAVETALKAYPNSEAGVAADLQNVVGRPESCSYAEYTLDSRALDQRRIGYTLTEYYTDAIFDPGNGFEPRAYGLAGLSSMVPHRTGQATATPVTLKGPESQALVWTPSYPASAQGTTTTYQATTSGDVQAQWSANFSVPMPSAQAIYAGAKIELRIYIESVEVNDYAGTPSTDGHQTSFQLALYGPGGLRVVQYLDMPKGFTGLMIQPLEVPADLYGVPLEASILLDLRNLSHKVTMRLDESYLISDVERPNYDGVQMPAGWGLTPFIGPTFEFKLPGIHIPPLLIHGLPGGLSQFAAGAEITWNKGEASTKIITAALPYGGQGGNRPRYK